MLKENDIVLSTSKFKNMEIPPSSLGMIINIDKTSSIPKFHVKFLNSEEIFTLRREEILGIEEIVLKNRIAKLKKI